MTRNRLVTAATGLALLAAGALFAGARAPKSDAMKLAPTVLTAEQRQALRAQLALYLRQDPEGIVSRTRSDGAVSIELDGRYQHAIVARPSAEGRPELACFDDPDAAVAFLAKDDRRATPTSPSDHKPQPEERDR